MLKVYCVFMKQLDVEGYEQLNLDQIFATKKLAQEYVDYLCGHRVIEERNLHDAPLPSTLSTKKKVKKGKIIITKDKAFRFV